MWDSLYEWSAYGAGTDVQLPDGEMVVQYFVPYLSAIQLYTAGKNLTTSRSFGSHYGNDPYRYGDEYYNPMLSRSLSTLSEDSVLSKLDLGDKKKNLGELYFEYIEMSSPYTRIPLVDKV
ncbi:hypothetical protein LUZ60_014822 [Juncus effusus]|nr:hypothetical protein LUZ60_014822 [Juncus effusus]